MTIISGINVAGDKVESNHPRPRLGKTKKDKEKGHIPGRKNRRIWDSSSRKWVKV
jgi:hypothetical protein